MNPEDDCVVPAEAWQALVTHDTHCGQVPNTDVWLVRRPMVPVLERVWSMTQYLHHGWWEQAALMDLMGYQVGPPAKLMVQRELYVNTFPLHASWNVHLWDRPQPDVRRIEHATMHPDRVSVMRGWAEQAKAYEWDVAEDEAPCLA
jgi:hypothetical protein